MDENIVVIGPHSLKFSTGDDAIEIMAEISGQSVALYFEQLICNNPTQKVDHYQGASFTPFVPEKYSNSNEQFLAEGFVSFRSLIANRTVQFDFYSDYFIYYTNNQWVGLLMFLEICQEIYKFFTGILSDKGCSELIFVPDTQFNAYCTGQQLNYEQIKEILIKQLGEPAPQWQHIAFLDEYKYLIVNKMPF
ncbi:MAG TPA: hypothetical protein PKO30_03115 [Prolixibacteraceae bacterium]|nr:hypothetical protein [Prolixibacteraceae bacterium]